ncbi:MAG: carboxypeptidase-like regulatory domain-containing protein [Melioribacteraceae bacterium]|nr:carboxypeptidase-like regulatory domain-containing protein [Melioribacteraceae bacterium]
MKKILLSQLTLLLILASCSEKGVEPPLEYPKYTSTIQGKVILENQTEHSNALIYISGINRGVSSDSSGRYILTFTESDSIYTGEYNLIYFLNDFDSLNAKIYLEKGKVKLDTLDVDKDGKIATIELKQSLRVEGWTDKSEYKIGDKMTFTVRFTNVSKKTVEIKRSGHVFFVGIYNDLQLYPYELSNPDPMGADFIEKILPGEYYQDSRTYRIPEGDIFSTIKRPLLPGEYLIITSIVINNRLQDYYDVFRRYVKFEWYKIARGKSPKYDYNPNKYIFPHIQIIE